jgi:hypothetical protein
VLVVELLTVELLVLELLDEPDSEVDEEDVSVDVVVVVEVVVTVWTCEAEIDIAAISAETPSRTMTAMIIACRLRSLRSQRNLRLRSRLLRSSDSSCVGKASSS